MPLEVHRKLSEMFYGKREMACGFSLSIHFSNFLWIFGISSVRGLVFFKETVSGGAHQECGAYHAFHRLHSEDK